VKSTVRCDKALSSIFLLVAILLLAALRSAKDVAVAMRDEPIESGLVKQPAPTPIRSRGADRD
jgi:hypothetical protein